MAEAIGTSYLPILILGIIAALLVLVTLLTARILGPSNPSGPKLSTYESGEITQGIGRGPIEVQYYQYILVFLILDIEAVFLIPFAVEFLNLSIQGIIVMLVFVLLLLEGWVYAWKKGALEWVR